jgi:hypothetical protein
LPAALLAVALSGCASVSNFNVADLNPLKRDDPLRASDYNYFYRRDVAANAGQVTAADLVGPDGRCAFEAAPAPSLGSEPVAAAPAAQEPINPRSNQALYFTAGPQAGPATGGPGSGQLPPEMRSGPRGIALQMTECQVVGVAGYTNNVAISANQRGDRVVTLTYTSGDRPGIYHFRNGRLVNMERGAESPQPKKPQRAAKPAKKQAAKQPRQ